MSGWPQKTRARMQSYNRFDVVLVPFPFTDRTTQKRRPALVLSNGDFFEDSGQIICSMITTAKRSNWKSDSSLSDWSEAGLPTPSKVRMKIFTLDARLVLKKLGRLSESDASTAAQSLTQVFA